MLSTLRQQDYSLRHGRQRARASCLIMLLHMGGAWLDSRMLQVVASGCLTDSWQLYPLVGYEWIQLPRVRSVALECRGCVIHGIDLCLYGIDRQGQPILVTASSATVDSRSTDCDIRLVRIVIPIAQPFGLTYQVQEESATLGVCMGRSSQSKCIDQAVQFQQRVEAARLVRPLVSTGWNPSLFLCLFSPLADQTRPKTVAKRVTRGVAGRHPTSEQEACALQH